MSSHFHSTSEAALQAITGHLHAQSSLVESLYEQSQCARWRIPFEQFVMILARSAASRFKPAIPSPGELESYLSILHLQDLALACACAQGNEAAWEYFIKTFRPYLHSSAAAILTPLGPSTAKQTVKPWRVSRRPNMSRFISLSSTSRILVIAAVPFQIDNRRISRRRLFVSLTFVLLT